MNTSRRYSPEVRDRAARMVLEQQKEHSSQWAAIQSIASKIGCTHETLRRWVRQAESNKGLRPGMSTADRDRLKQLEREAAKRKTDGRLAQARGRLPWPYDGAVTGLFGRQRHPQYNTDIFRRGIEIKAREGDAVKAVYQGVAVYADWFKGYGLVVVLDHGDHYYTLYAHLGKTDIKVGEAVTVGQAIGVVGETGLSDEQTLYFELRHHGTPLDPLTWLKKRG